VYICTRYFVVTAYNKASQTGLFTKLRKPRITVWYSHHHGVGVLTLSLWQMWPHI